jgi:hypothetical protein
LSRTAPAPAALSDGLARLAGWCAYASGVAAIIGLVFLFAFFGGLGDHFGPMNDVMVVIHYVLLLPIVAAVYQLVQPYGPRFARVATAVGLAGMLAVIVLQALLVAGVIPFEQQIGMVIVAFLVATVWFVAVTILGRSTGVLPTSIPLAVLAGLVFGYPVWAYLLGRRLLGR